MFFLINSNNTTMVDSGVRINQRYIITIN